MNSMKYILHRFLADSIDPAVIPSTDIISASINMNQQVLVVD